MNAVRPIQLLTPDGELVDNPAVPLDVTPQLCRRFYLRMRLARRFDEEAYALQRQGELTLWLMALGQEAAQVGSISALRPADFVFPSYREHAAALCRGLSPAELLVQWRGCRNSGWDPARYRFHINTLMLGAQLLHATGYAMGVRLDGADEVVLAYFGDGASSQGEANEAFNWAATFDAPMIFFCQNNQWAISTPTAQQMSSPLYQRGAGFGLRTELVDGNDVLAVHAVTRAVVDSIRDGDGPALIEAVTYRLAGHSTADDPRRYRSAAEEESWRARDPLCRLERLLERRGWTDAAHRVKVDERCEQFAIRTREECLSLPEPDLATLFDTVSAEAHPALAAERDRQLHLAGGTCE